MFRTNFQEKTETYVRVKYSDKSYDLGNQIGIRFPDGAKIFLLYAPFRLALEPAHWRGGKWAGA
jgi:hypothetical protein